MRLVLLAALLPVLAALGCADAALLPESEAKLAPLTEKERAADERARIREQLAALRQEPPARDKPMEKIDFTAPAPEATHERFVGPPVSDRPPPPTPNPFPPSYTPPEPTTPEGNIAGVWAAYDALPPSRKTYSTFYDAFNEVVDITRASDPDGSLGLLGVGMNAVRHRWFAIFAPMGMTSENGETAVLSVMDFATCIQSTKKTLQDGKTLKLMSNLGFFYFSCMDFRDSKVTGHPIVVDERWWNIRGQQIQRP